jgi:hypothetical protein
VLRPAARCLQGYDPAAAKALFFDIYINTFATPESNIAFPGVAPWRGAGPPGACFDTHQQVGGVATSNRLQAAPVGTPIGCLAAHRSE